MGLIKVFVSLLLGVLLLSSGAAGEEPHSEYGQTCIDAESPKSCMESYGFSCHRIETPSKSFEAYVIGCNLALGGGRNHFVQMLNNDQEWTIEVQKTSTPDVVIMQADPSDSEQMLASYLQDDMADFNVTGNGSLSIEGVAGLLHFQSGARKIGDVATIRGVCGLVFKGLLDDKVAEEARAVCEPNILRAIQIRSQFSSHSPYRAGGAGDIEWQSTTISLMGEDLGLVLDGHYTFEPEGTPCRWLPECCARESARYLDSCRVATEEEMSVVKNCLAKPEVSFRTEEYFSCLSNAGVKTGCEPQDDGSRLCY